jgi:hypothetical protein
MPNDYTQKDDLSYTAELEMSDVDGATMTDAGVLARDLYPIHDCILSPGDPSPVGRTEDGDLAYPEFRDVTYMEMQRSHCARLAYVLAKENGITEYPKSASSTDEVILMQLIQTALPGVFYEETAHGEIARENDIAKLLAGDLDSLESIWKDPAG